MTTSFRFLLCLLFLLPSFGYAGGDGVNNGGGYRESQMMFIWNHLAEDLMTFRQSTSLTPAETDSVIHLVESRRAFSLSGENLVFKKETDFRFPIENSGQAAAFVTEPQAGALIVINQDALYRHTTEGSYRQDYQESFNLLIRALVVQKPAAESKTLFSKLSTWLNSEIKIINLAAYRLPQIQTKLVLNQILVNDQVQVINLTEAILERAPCAESGMSVQNLSFDNFHYSAVQGVLQTDASLLVEVAGEVTYDCHGASHVSQMRGNVQWSLRFDRTFNAAKSSELRFHERDGKIEALSDVLFFNLREI